MGEKHGRLLGETVVVFQTVYHSKAPDIPRCWERGGGAEAKNCDGSDIFKKFLKRKFSVSFLCPIILFVRGTNP